MPGGALKLLPGRRFNWYYETEPQGAGWRRRLYWPRGKVVAARRDQRAPLRARPIAPTMMRGRRRQRRLVLRRGAALFQEIGTHVRPIPVARTDGPLSVVPSDIRGPLLPAYLAAAEAAGHPATADFNGAAPEGVASMTRRSATDAAPALRTPSWACPRPTEPDGRGRCPCHAADHRSPSRRRAGLPADRRSRRSVPRREVILSPARSIRRSS